ncbi:MAG TPA: bifunctional UDP-sugar hydrolase/5'-nucleotidase [Candidatus Obscuribacterales bacterium]
MRAAIIALFLLICQANAQSQQASKEPGLVLTILHTNDLHAHDEPFEERGKSVGGMARIAHLIRAIRKSTANVVTVDAGDIFQGTPFFKLYHGEVEVSLLNQLGYDLYTIGNHEFDEGPENLEKQLKAARFDVLSANIDASALPGLAAIIKPSVVKEFGGQKVGFVGAVTPDLVAMSLKTGAVRVKGVDGSNESGWIAPIKEEVERLTAQGVDKIVLVTHAGLERDKQLAQAIPEVDAIVGGHSHTRLNKPIVVGHADGSRAIIVQAGCYGRALGKLELVFDHRGRLVFPGTRSRLINITSAVPQTPDVKRYLEEKGRPIASLRETVAGVALGDFDNRFSRYPWDSPIGDLVCDALADAGTRYGATIALQNRGGIRARIDRGLVTMEKIEEVLPFDNRLMFATVKGSALARALEYSLSGILGARFLDVHGLKIAYEPARPAGNRINFVLAKAPDGSWKELNPDAPYKIALNDFTFNGGEGYEFSAAADVSRTQDRLSKVLADYLIKKKKVTPSPPNRIVPVTSGLLTIDKSGKAPKLKVNCPVPGAHMTLVVGSGPGVEPIAGPIPVPVSNPRIIETGIEPAIKGRAGAADNAQLEHSWQLPLRSYRPPERSDSRGELWAAVVIHPPRRGSPIISAPVRLPSD